MTILLRDQITGLYFVGRGNWSPNKERAYDFPSWDDVFRIARRYELARGEMLFDFPDANASFSIPVGAAGATSWNSLPHETTDLAEQSLPSNRGSV